MAYTVRRYRREGPEMPRELEGYRETVALIREIYPERVALTRAEAAKILGCSARTLQRKTEIPCVTVDQTVRYPVHDLARWITRKAAGGH